MLINAEMSIGKRTGAEFAKGAIKYESPIKLTKDSVVRARTMDGGQWAALVEHQFQSGRAGTPLRLTEIMYNPPGGSEYEFVELHNSGDSEVPLGWYQFDGIAYTFDGDATIAPGRYIVLASTTTPTRSSSLPRAAGLRLVQGQSVQWWRAVDPARHELAPGG